MEAKTCFWAIPYKEEGVAVIKLTEWKKGYELVNVDKRHNLAFTRYALYHSNQRRFGITPAEVDRIVDFAFNDKPIEVYQTQTEKRITSAMANTTTFLRSELEKRNIFRGTRCGQPKKPHNYFEKKGGKLIDLGVTSKEAVYDLKGWKLPAAPKEDGK
jgi:hypothetical protein